MEQQGLGKTIETQIHGERNFFEGALNHPLTVDSVKISGFKIHPWVKNYLVKDIETQKMPFAQILSKVERIREEIEKSDVAQKGSVAFKPNASFPQDHVKLNFLFKKKSSYHFSFNQSVNSEAKVMFGVSGAFKNPFGFLDRYSFDFTKTIDSSRQRSLVLNYDFPSILFKNHQMKASYNLGQKLLDREFIEEADSKGLFLFSNDGKGFVSLENVRRINRFGIHRVSPYAFIQDVIPYTTTQLKVHRIIKSTLDKPGRMYTGDHLEGTGTLGVSGNEGFFKGELSYRKFFNFKERPSLPRKMNLVNLEYAGSLGAAIPVWGKLRVNDRLFVTNTRGFNWLGARHLPLRLQREGEDPNLVKVGDHFGNDFFVKNSIRVNFFGFPWLEQAENLVPFLHFSHFFVPGPFMKVPSAIKPASPLRNPLKFLRDTNKLSAGVGISFETGIQSRLELIYNVFHLSRPSDDPVNLQIRLSYNE